MVAVIRFIFIFLLPFTATGLVSAKTASDLFIEVSPSVVIVHGLDKNNNLNSQGSGVVVQENIVATNCHVVENSEGVMVYVRGNVFPAKIKKSDHERDVCILSVNKLNVPSVSIGSTNDIKVGQKIYALGAPQGLELTLSEGIVAGLRSFDEGQLLQISAPISPGSSGGGLFDDLGRLVGLTTLMVTSGQALNFAIPVEWVFELLNNDDLEEVRSDIGDEYFEKSRAFKMKEDWRALRDFSLNWLNKYPYHPQARVDLIDACHHLDDYLPLIELDGMKMAREPEATESLWNYAATLSLDEKSPAITNLVKALNADLKVAEEWVDLGDAYRHIVSMQEKSLESYRQALRLDSKNLKARIGLSIVFYGKNQYQIALEEIERAIELDSGNADAWFMRATILNALEKYGQAFLAFDMAQILDPGRGRNAWHLFNFSVAALGAGHIDEGIDMLNDSLDIDPSFYRAWQLLGNAYKMIKKDNGGVMGVYNKLKAIDEKMARQFLDDIVFSD